MNDNECHHPKIGMFTYGLCSYSGAGFQALKLATYLKEKARILIFDKSKNGPTFLFRFTEISGVKIVCLPRYPIISPLVITYFVIRNHIKVFHLHGFVKEALIVGLILRRRLILKTTMLDGDDFQTQNKYKLAGLRRFLIRNVDRNIAQCDTVKKRNSQCFPSGRIAVIPNLVEIRHETPLRSEEKEPATFAFVGVVCERKRPDLAIKYFVEHYAGNPDARLYIAGPIPKEKKSKEAVQEYYEYCIELIPAHFRDRVFFLGTCDEIGIRTLLRRSKALLFFSEREGFPNVVLEAMAENCVPIVSKMNGIGNDLLRHGESGFVVDPFDKGAGVPLARINEVVNMQGAFNHALKEYSPDTVARRVVSLYREVNEI